MFDPALAGYWGSDDVAAATEIFTGLVTDHAGEGRRRQGVAARRQPRDGAAGRARCPAGRVRLYTGDDFNYPELIDGDGTHYSDALLGIFAAIYPAASTALQAYDAGRPEEARAILDSTRELGLHLFGAPTFFYKTGVAFLSWLNGRQPGFSMVGGLHAGRSLPHLVAGLPAGRPGRAAARSRAGRAPDARAAGRRRIRALRWTPTPGCRSTPRPPRG